MNHLAPKKAKRSAFVYSAVVFLVVFILGVGLSYAWQSQQIKVKRSEALNLAQSYSFHLKSVIEHNLSGNYTLAALVHEFGGFTRWFPQVAESLHRIYPEVNNFALSPNGIVSQVYPLEGNESVIGFNQLMDIEQGSDAWVALQEQRMILSGPFKLVQGGSGVVARLPVSLEDRYGGVERFWGFTSVVIRIDALLENTKFSGLADQGYVYRLQRVDTDKPMLVTEYQPDLLQEPESVEIKMPNVLWRLDVSPEEGWSPSNRLFNYGLLCLLVALVVARFVYMGFRINEQKAQLTELLSEQTENAQLSDQRLLSTQQAIPDPLLEIDCQGNVIEIRLPEDESELASFFSVGEHYSQQLPDAVTRIFEYVLDEVRSSESASHRGAVFSLELESEQTVWFEMSVVLRLAYQEHGRFIVLLRDVTQRQEAEQQQRIAATAFETQDGILISDQDNRIIRVNQAFQRLSGYSEAEVLGQTPAILQSGKHDKSFYQDMFEQLTHKGHWEGEVWNRRKNGEIYPEWLGISTVRDSYGQISNYVATFKDISDIKASERQIRQLHYYDSLTQLGNRTLLLEEMNYHIDKGMKDRQSAVLFIDLDHFKDVNDVWGHKIGDNLLQEVAERLQDITRSHDLVARFGGDEFLILLETVDISQNSERAIYRASHVAEKVMSAMSLPFVLNGVEYQIAASLGIALFDERCKDPLDVIKQAELAMYEAKDKGRSRHCFYQQGMQERVLERVQLESDLRHALENNELTLYLQPQWDQQRSMIGAETLLRWLHPERGMVSPGIFIPLAEDSRLILPIGEWVLEQACQWLSDWQQDASKANMILSVNVSAVQFAQEHFVRQVENILHKHQTPAHLLQLELTESMLAHDQQDIISKMSALKDLGVLISLDDFGTGYSSLSYLHRLPIDQLKIDQSFVANIDKDSKNASLAESIISLGHNLGMEVIAEGVETDAQFTWLASKQCDLFQGFGLAKPMPLEQFIVLNQTQSR